MTTEGIKVLIAETQERLGLLKQLLTMEDEFDEIVGQVDRRSGASHIDRKQAIRIVSVVAEECEVCTAAIMGRRRVGKLGTYRQIAMSLVYTRMEVSQEQAGRFFHRDHGTVLHALKTVQNLSQTEPKFKALVQRIEVRLDAEQPETSTVRSAKV